MDALTSSFSDQPDVSILSSDRRLVATDIELGASCSLVQGHLMDPGTWNALLAGYGFCERHAWLHLGVETTFRRGHLLGPAVLYRALIEQSLRAFRESHLEPTALVRNLRSTSRCPLCTAEMIPNGEAGLSLSQARLEQIRGCSRLTNVAYDTVPLWQKFVCAECAGDNSQNATGWACRRHLIRQIEDKRPVDLGEQEMMLQMMQPHLVHFEHSFDKENSSASDPDRAALIAAIGWTSGWRPLLDLLS